MALHTFVIHLHCHTMSAVPRRPGVACKQPHSGMSHPLECLLLRHSPVLEWVAALHGNLAAHTPSVVATAPMSNKDQACLRGQQLNMRLHSLPILWKRWLQHCQQPELPRAADQPQVGAHCGCWSCRGHPQRVSGLDAGSVHPIGQDAVLLFKQKVYGILQQLLQSLTQRNRG